MKAGIIGVGWGQVHLHALRELGVDVHWLCDRDLAKVQRVACETGVPHATTRPDDLQAADLVVIATPATTHAELLAKFTNKQHVICEKPLVGVDGDAAELPELKQPALVNYAFNFLHTAQLANQYLPGLGERLRVQLCSQVNLPLQFDVKQWFLETSSHPLSWLLHQLGEPASARHQLNDNQLTVQLTTANQHQIDIEFTLGGEPGIYHQLSVTGSQGELAFNGSYVPGETWRFSPLMLNGKALNHGEHSQSDCWLDANRRAIAHMLQYFSGELSHQLALADGLFDFDKALWLERVLTDR